MNKNKILLFIIIYSTGICLAGKSSKIRNESNTLVIAKVADIVITEEEFKTNYEFGLPNLKYGNDLEERKLNYLKFLINEKILSKEAENMGLTQTKEFQLEIEKIEKDLLLQSVIDNDIKKRINITFEEVKERINKSSVKIKLTLWPESDYENAHYIKNLLEEKGLDETISLIKKENSTLTLSKESFETDYLNWWEIPTQIYNKIGKLEFGKISDPIKVGNLYYLVRVDDIKRESITQQAYFDKYPTVRKQIYSEKLESVLKQFIDSVLTNQHIKINYEVSQKLNGIIENWIMNRQKTETNFDEYSFESTKGKISFEVISKYFRFDLIDKSDPISKNTYAISNQILALALRDYFLVQYAYEKQYEKTKWVNDELQKWKRKLGFLAYKENLIKNINKKFISKYLQKEIEKVIPKYKVEIDLDKLKSVKVIETEKSKNSSYQIHVLGTNRLAEPIVDGIWRKTNRKEK